MPAELQPALHSPQLSTRRGNPVPLAEPDVSGGILQEPSSDGSPSTPAADLDGIWKAALQAWLPGCLALFWPDVHGRVDWSAEPVFLDKELQQLDVLRKKGVQQVDVLVRLKLRSGTDALLLLHIEVQGGYVDSAFAERMFRYRLRLYEKYPQEAIMSCAILLDRENGPETETFYSGGIGDEIIFRFPVINLARWRHRVAELEVLAPQNPFAVVVMAQLEYRATGPDTTRLVRKLNLARQLAKWNYGAKARWALFRIIDSLLVLPGALDEQFSAAVQQEGVSAMLPELTSVERVMKRRLTEQLTEQLTGQITEQLTEQITEQLTEQITEQLTEQITEQITRRLKGQITAQVTAAVNEKARHEAGVGFLESQIQQKFGLVPDWAHKRLQQADEAAIQKWALNILNAQRIEDVFDSAV